MSPFNAAVPAGGTYTFTTRVGDGGLLVKVSGNVAPYSIDIEDKPVGAADAAFTTAGPFETYGPVSFADMAEHTIETGQLRAVARVALTNNADINGRFTGRAETRPTDEWLRTDSRAHREELAGDRVYVGPSGERDLRYDSEIGSLVVVEHD